MSVPPDLYYTNDHEWVRIEGNVATVGITFHAQEELTDVVFVELPDLDREVDEAEATAVVESVKAASDIFAPLAGKIVGANEALESDPSLVNSDSYGEGWIFKIDLADAGAVSSLLSAEAYAGLIG